MPVLVPGYEGVSASVSTGVRGYWYRGTRVLVPGYQGRYQGKRVLVLGDEGIGTGV